MYEFRFPDAGTAVVADWVAAPVAAITPELDAEDDDFVVVFELRDGQFQLSVPLGGSVRALAVPSELAREVYDECNGTDAPTESFDLAPGIPNRIASGGGWVHRALRRGSVALLRAILRAMTRKFGAPPTWEWRPGLLPRRRWDVPFSGLYPRGLNEAWCDAQIEHVLVNHGQVLSVALPEDLLRQGLDPSAFGRLLRPLLVAKHKRVGGAVPTLAHKRYAKRWDFDFVKPDSAWTPPVVVANQPLAPWPPNNQRQSLPPGAKNGLRLVHELLNGMAPPHLAVDRDDQGQPIGWRARYRFTDLPMGDAFDRSHGAYYRLPDVDVTLRLIGGYAQIDAIHLRYRDLTSPPDYAAGTATYGPWRTIAMGAAPTSALQDAARQVLVGVMGLSGQLDGHVAMGHILMETFAVAVHRTLNDQHPVARVLLPRLEEVDVVNRNADDQIWGPLGVFPVCSALTPEAISQRIRERLCATDWVSFRPRSTTIAPNHDAPRVFTAYWEQVVTPYVDDAIPPVAQWSPQQVTEMQSFFEELRQAGQQYGLRHAPWDGGPADWVDDAELAPHKAPGTDVFPLVPVDDAHVRQLVRFVVYHTTMGHSWPNVRQIQAAGDPEYGAFGLKDDLDPTTFTPAGWAQAQPDPSDALFQMLVADTLTRLDVETFAKELTPGIRVPDPIQPGLAARFAQLAPHLPNPQVPFPDPLLGALAHQLSRCNR